MPLVPTATQSLPEHDTPSRVAVTPEVCGSQVWPPFVVPRMVPAPPTASHVLALVQLIESIVWVVPPPACWVTVPVTLVESKLRVTPCLPTA